MSGDEVSILSLHLCTVAGAVLSVESRERPRQMSHRATIRIHLFTLVLIT
jgi:hypothetical protein